MRENRTRARSVSHAPQNGRARCCRDGAVPRRRRRCREWSRQARPPGTRSTTGDRSTTRDTGDADHRGPLEHPGPGGGSEQPARGSRRSRPAEGAWVRRPSSADGSTRPRAGVDLAPLVGEDDRPNVVVLMMDDMRDDDLQFMPHVKRLITDQGVRFTNMFSPHPLCCPARASFVSGLYSHNHEVWSHKKPYGLSAFDDSETCPALAARAGRLRHELPGEVPQRLRPDAHAGRRVLAALHPARLDRRRASVDNVHDEPEAKHLQGGTYQYFDTTLSDNGALEPHQGVYQTTPLRRHHPGDDPPRGALATAVLPADLVLHPARRVASRAGRPEGLPPLRRLAADLAEPCPSALRQGSLRPSDHPAPTRTG